MMALAQRYDNCEDSRASTFPDRLFGMLTGYQTSATLKAAFELDLFSEFSSGTAGVADLAKHCAADTRAMRILCNGLTSLGVLTKDAHGYAPARNFATFLDPHLPSYI